MPTGTPERRYLERQITFARPVFLALTLLELFGTAAKPVDNHPYFYAAGYLAAAILLAAWATLGRAPEIRVPLAIDIVASTGFLLITPEITAFWFPFLFIQFAAGIRWGMQRSLLLAGAMTAGVAVRTLLVSTLTWPEVVICFGLVAGTFAAGAGMAFLGFRHRRHEAEQEFLARVTGMLQVELGVAESIRRVLSEFLEAFDCDLGLIVYLDSELERIFVWRLRKGDTGRITPENLPVTRQDGFLLDQPGINLGWNDLDSRPEGYGWHREDGRRLLNVPTLPGPVRKEWSLHSLLAVTFDFSGRPAGRVIVGNARRRFTPGQLRALEHVVRQFASPLENLFLLRHIRARAIEGERGRISRDLHDGILQTLLSVTIQLDVLRRKLPQDPSHVEAALAGLEQTVKNETGELRSLVTDLRPLRVQSADLVDLMRGFAERFRNESAVALDLLIDSAELELPDRVCRDLFQIYREALNNIKKHAHASHVVVKLWQDDSRVVLVVDDNGEGFSFAGRFSGDELDRLRLGPISIKERARSVGGVLTVESTPGHGARLTIEVPLG